MDQTFFRTHVYDVSDSPAVKRQKIEDAVYAPAMEEVTRGLVREATAAMARYARDNFRELIEEHGESVVFPIVMRALTEATLVREVTAAVEKAAPLLRKAIQPKVDALFLTVVD
jgi:hypothetical protein